MGGYIRNYMKSVEAALEDEETDLEALKREHLVQIGFIQHERLVHLMVTIMCCLLLFIGLGLYFMTGILAIMAVNGLMLILVLSYLLYYFFIENSTQKLYKQYNRICSRLEPESRTIASILTDEKMTK